MSLRHPREKSSDYKTQAKFAIQMREDLKAGRLK